MRVIAFVSLTDSTQLTVCNSELSLTASLGLSLAVRSEHCVYATEPLTSGELRVRLVGPMKVPSAGLVSF